MQERIWTKEDFPFAGQTVVLSPDFDSPRAGEEGIVISIEGREDDLIIVLKDMENYANNWSVKVKWRDGGTSRVRIPDLILVDKPLEDIIDIKTTDGDRYIYSKSDEEREYQVVREIIKDRMVVRSENIFGQAFKDYILEKV